MKNPFALLVFLLFAGAAVNHLVYKHTEKIEQVETLKKAYSGYTQGETADSVGKREEAFNKSLTYYTNLERDNRPEFGNGRLYFNIGNAYFQLENYPFAVLYYYKAQNLMPRDEVVQRNLSTALKKLDVEPAQNEAVLRNLFFFHYSLSLPERLQLLTFFSCAAFFLFSFFIWTRLPSFKVLGKMAACGALIFALSCLFSHYFSPIEAVVVKSSGLYRDSGFQYAKVQEDPILSGNKVEVLEILDREQGAWLKIRLNGGELGYVPQEAVRII